MTPALVRAVEQEELARIESSIGADAYRNGRFAAAAALFEQVALSDDFVEFLTLPAYAQID